MAIMADVLYQANNLLHFQTKQAPIVMSYSRHVAQTGKMEIVNEIQRYVRTDRESLYWSFGPFALSKQPEIKTTPNKVTGDIVDNRF